MIKKITLDNFKAFKHAEIDIKPLTILIGPNSGGKTSLLNSISSIQQTLRSSGTDILKFADTINFGDFDDFVHQNSDSKEMSMKFEFDDSTFFDFTIFKDEDELCLKKFACDNGEIRFYLENITKIESSEPNFYHSGNYHFDIKQNPNFNDYFNQNTKMTFYRESFLIVPTAKSETFSSIISNIESAAISIIASDNKPYSKNVRLRVATRKERSQIKYHKVEYEDLIQLAQTYLSLEKSAISFNRKVKQKFENINYIGPLRATASPSYQFGHFESVGNRGDNAVPIIAENEDLRKEVTDILKRQNIAKDIEILAKSTGKIFEFKLKTDITDSAVNFPYVGFGTSQILPIIVQSLLSNDNSMIVIEQPETHLHPRVQADFASFLVNLIERNTKFLIETHSEYFVERIRTCIMKNPNLADHVAIYYVEQNEKEKQSMITPIIIDSGGRYDRLPEGYLTNIRVKEIHDQMEITFNKLEKNIEL